MIHETFDSVLTKHGLELIKDKPTILQINTGLLCNQVCQHCHLDAGPHRVENITRKTVDNIISFAAAYGFKSVDITGGAPELNSNLKYLIEKISPLAHKVTLRSNLTALDDKKNDLIDFLKDFNVTITASFPSLNESQTETQRGPGIFMKSIRMLQILNKMGYGQADGKFELNLVSNPVGAYLSASQSASEKRFKKILSEKWGITFNHLYNLSNVPLGRFRNWLVDTGNYEEYIKHLISAFNPDAVDNLMCRNLISVSWDGYLYDCDFNLSEGLFMGGKKRHISEIFENSFYGSRIVASEHCFTCTAGSGFT